MDGPSFPSQSYPLAGVQTADRLSAASGVASAAPAPSLPSATSAPSGPITAAIPACVPDFSGTLTGDYVLDWRDPTTHTVLVQIPMRTALAVIDSSAAAAATGQVGHHLNETV
jgi:hypothetical protein